MANGHGTRTQRGVRMRATVLAAVVLAVALPMSAVAAPAAERRSADAVVHIAGADGAAYRLDLAVTQVLPSPDAVLDAVLTRCVATDCEEVALRRVLREDEFRLAEDGKQAAVTTEAFGLPLTASWRASGDAAATLVAVRGASSSAGVGIDEKTRPAAARVTLGRLGCDIRDARIHTAVFAGAGDVVSEREANAVPAGLVPRGGKSPRCAPTR